SAGSKAKAGEASLRPTRRESSQAPSERTAVISSQRDGRLMSMAARPPPSITAAEATRMASSGLAEPTASLLVRHAAEAAPPAVVGLDGLDEVLLAEVRPERWRHVELGVGHLPEQKVGDAQVPAGADEQLGVGHVGKVQVAGEGGLV